MTEAPERIWATSDNRNGSWTCEEMPAKWGAKTTAYIRADLSPSPEVVKELVEAAKAVLGNTNENGEGVVLIVHLLRLRAILAKLEGGE